MAENSLKDHFGIYPRKIEVIKTPEYKEILSEKTSKIDEEWLPIIKAFDIVYPKFDVHFRGSIRSDLERRKEKEISEAERKSRIESNTILNKKRLECLLEALNSEDATPLCITRSIKYYKRELDMAYGDCDTGYDKWTEIVPFTYFEQSQEFRIQDKEFSVAVAGDIFAQDTEPSLKINWIGLHRSSYGQDWRQQHKEETVFKMKTGVEANEFFYKEDSSKGLENIKSNDAEIYNSLIKPVAGIIKYINAPLGKVPYKLTEDSLVKYDGETGEPSLISREKFRSLRKQEQFT
ncbi:MAG: hypothetical protein Q7S74_01180 [Nanoarchaeota archaeon]|nr:hypothetical protein [Nanoarchaeota archaeon]